MPQALLPLVPAGATAINDFFSVVREDGQWTYFLGVRPVFQHGEDDRRSFRMFTAQLICQGSCQQRDIVRTFGVSTISVKRSVKRFREQGIAGFYQPRRVRGAAVLTPEVVQQAQTLLYQGHSRRHVAQQLGIGVETLRKAIGQGRVSAPAQASSPAAPPDAGVSPSGQAATPGVGNEPDPAAPERPRPACGPEAPSLATDQSQRTVQDAAAADGLGMACTRVLDRVAASLGLLPGGAATQFAACRDVPLGGVMCALPALAENGLFQHLSTCFPSLGGYYTTLQVMTLLGYMALCRIKTVEQLQYQPPGELGKLLGLDRIPEVRCLRSKLTSLAAGEGPQTWAGLLSRDWLAADPELAGALYVDGHVRLYHGQLTKLPPRYVARQKLCLRGTTDYWTCDALGQPFFVIERPIDHGLLEVLRNEIVPRLLKEVPHQPTPPELDADPHLHRFVLLFDREGYSPEFFREMWQQHRIACVTYHKYPKAAWPEDEFVTTEVSFPGGEVVSMKLAERGSRIGDRKKGCWVREVRKRTASGHQTSVIGTCYRWTAPKEAAWMFSRWSQENFFRYAMEHFAIDLLSEYGTAEIPETKRPVVNPARRALDQRRRALQSRLQQRQARYGVWTLYPESDPAEMDQWLHDKAELVEEIQQLEHELDEVKKQQQATPTHLSWETLPEEAKCARLAPGRKRLLDTVKMIAYRAETALAAIVREVLSRADDARSLLRDLFTRTADILPDEGTGTLCVRVHASSNPRHDRAIAHLLGQTTAAEHTYPGTKLKLTYALAGAAPNQHLGSSLLPRNQEV
jgi:transposase